MPVIRPLPGARGSVIAYSEQLDLWFGRQSHSEGGSLTAPSLTGIRREDSWQNLLGHARSHSNLKPQNCK